MAAVSTKSPDNKNAKEAAKIVSVRLEAIRTDGGTQSRARLDEETGTQYAGDMKAGAAFPHIIVFHGPDDRLESPTYGKFFYWLASGFHRLYAMKLIGRLEEFVQVKEGSRRDAVLFSVSCNEKHGLRLNNEDKWHKVRLILSDREWWGKADQWVKDQCHVSASFVGKVRDVMIQEEELRRQRARERAAQQTTAQPISAAPAPQANNEDRTPPKTQHGSVAAPPATLSTENSRMENKHQTDNGTDEPMPAQNQLEEAVPQPETTETDEEQTRLGQDGRLQRTARIGKKRRAVVKAVIVETEIEQQAKLMAQLIRSIPKAVHQAKRLGWGVEKFLLEALKIWRAVPVADDQGNHVKDEEEEKLLAFWITQVGEDFAHQAAEAN